MKNTHMIVCCMFYNMAGFYDICPLLYELFSAYFLHTQ